MQKTPLWKVTIELDEETHRALLMIGSLNGRGQSIEDLVFSALFHWRIDHPIDLIRPSDAEVSRYLRRGFDQKVLAYALRHNLDLNAASKEDESHPVQLNSGTVISYVNRTGAALNVTVALDVETVLALQRGTITSGPRYSIEQLILNALFWWRHDHPIKILRPSGSELARYYKRNGVFKVLGGQNALLNEASAVPKPLDKQRRRTA